MDTEYKQNLCRKLDSLNRLEREGYRPYRIQQDRYLDVLFVFVFFMSFVTYVGLLPSVTQVHAETNLAYCQDWKHGMPVIGATEKQMKALCK